MSIAPRPSKTRRDEWDAEVTRAIQSDDEFDARVVASLQNTGLFQPSENPRRVLAEMKTLRNVGEYVHRIWDGVMREATFEPLCSQDQGRLAARVLLACQEGGHRINDPAPCQTDADGAPRLLSLVPEVLGAFPTAGTEFEQGLVAELEVEAP